MAGLRKPHADELRWAVVIMGHNDVEVDFFETQDEAEDNAKEAIGEGCSVYVMRVEKQS